MKIASYCPTNQLQDSIFVSVSEDSIARVWRFDSLQQVIKHPNSLWDIDIQQDYNHVQVITACSDGVLSLNSEWLLIDRPSVPYR